MQYGLVRARVVNNRAAGITHPGELRSVLIARQDIPSLVRWSFLFFAFTLPFQAVDWGFTHDSLSISKISGLLFFLIYGFYHNPLSRNRSFPHPPAAMWWFLGYIVIYTLNGFFVPEEFFYAFRVGLITLVQLIVLFWCASGLFIEETIARRFLLTYSIGVGIVALGVILHIPGFSGPEVAGRASAFGANANSVAGMMAWAAVILIGLYLNTVFKHSISTILVVVLALTIVAVMVKTGSRGGVLAFMVGCVVYAVPFLKAKRKWAAIVLVSLFTVVVVYLAVTNPMFSERVQQSYHGDLAAREVIYDIVIEMILERPLFGWTPFELNKELGWRGGWPKGSDVHNSFLHLLLEVGLVGAIPFVVGVWLCGWAAWKARLGHLGLLPIALLLTLIVNNMSATYLYDKTLWLTLALCVAAECAVAKAPRKRLAVLMRGRS